MTYVDHDSFKSSGIQEMSAKEVDEVGGGGAAVVVAVVIVAAVFIAGAIDGWYDQGDQK